MERESEREGPVPGREAGWDGMVQSPSGEHKGMVTEPVWSLRSDICWTRGQCHRILKSGPPLVVVVFTLNPRTREAEARGSECRSQSGLHSEF